MADLDPDTLAAKIAAGLKSALGRPADDDEDDGVGRVPRNRFNDVIRERNELRAKLSEVQEQVTAYQAAAKSQLDGIKAQTAEELKRIAQAHQEDMALSERGIKDPLGRRAIREAWEAEDKEQRGKSPTEWWDRAREAREAHLADPEKAAAPKIPRTLLGYLPDPPAKEEPPAKAPPKGAPPPKDGGKPPPKNGDIMAGLKADASVEELIAHLAAQR